MVVLLLLFLIQEELEATAAAAMETAKAAEDLATRSTVLRKDVQAEKDALGARLSALEEAVRSASAATEPARAAAAAAETAAEERAGGVEGVANLRARCEELELEAVAAAEKVYMIARSWGFRSRLSLLNRPPCFFFVDRTRGDVSHWNLLLYSFRMLCGTAVPGFLTHLSRRRHSLSPTYHTPSFPVPFFFFYTRVLPGHVLVRSPLVRSPA